VYWIPISFFALGACLIVFAFATGVGLRKFTLAIALFILGVISMGGSLAYGYHQSATTHGLRVDVPNSNK